MKKGSSSNSGGPNKSVVSHQGKNEEIVEEIIEEVGEEVEDEESKQEQPIFQSAPS